MFIKKSPKQKKKTEETNDPRKEKPGGNFLQFLWALAGGSLDSTALRRGSSDRDRWAHTRKGNSGKKKNTAAMRKKKRQSQRAARKVMRANA